MDFIYTTISDLLDGLLPTAILADFQGLNDLLAYVITIGIIWVFLFRPLLKMFKVVK